MNLEDFFPKYGAKSNNAYYTFFKRPLVPASAALFNILFQVPVEIGFSVINSIFYMGSVILFYNFVKKLGYNKNIAFTSALLFSCSFTMLVIGASCMTDVGGYFFSILILYYAIGPITQHWNSNKNESFLGSKFSIKNYVIIGVITAIGMLNRETVIFTTIAIFLYILLEDLKFKKEGWVVNEVKNLVFMIISIGIAIVPLFLWIFFGVLCPMGGTFSDFTIADLTISRFLRQDVMEHTLFIIALAFTLCYVFILVGLAKEKDKNRINLSLVFSLVMLIPIIMHFWTTVCPVCPQYRVFFILFPFFIPISALGLHELCKILESKFYLENFNKYFWYLLLIGIYIAINFIMGIFYMTNFIYEILSSYAGDITKNFL